MLPNINSYDSFRHFYVIFFQREKLFLQLFVQIKGIKLEKKFVITFEISSTFQLLNTIPTWK